MIFYLDAILVLAWAIWFFAWIFAWCEPRTLSVMLFALLFIGFLGHALLVKEIPSPVPFPSLDEMTQIQPTSK